ncbi:hypothetical protein S14_39 [Shewanella sp. phage 1/4]|uniref:hypothetical protein n=1 Tax=Shewanella phage 1/4 TaxID=1458859 RepID=UPI0004F632E2|nr:hypothetical protein S14_39 [Shewanella sp. phage 1/4]AHK11151.1 hypothetical protein S14_39 [Shewanella sp. phage 1/4]
MTPCEKLGYKVGDLFEVVVTDSRFFNYCSVIRLLEDDNSHTPLFVLVSGSCSEFGGKSFFHLDNVKPLKTDLTKITKPFGELDNQTKKDLLCAWVDGAEIERREYFGDKWYNEYNPLWTDIFSYRVKPTISAKAKLISEAQQKLKEAQETWDKLQSL